MLSLRHWSIQKKLVISMAVCLLAFILISGGLGAWLIGNAVRDRVVNEDLPTAVGKIAVDVQRRIGEPLTAARGVAANSYVQAWEEQGLPDAGADDWKRYAQSLKASEHAATVFWVSKDTGKYYTDTGMTRTITDKDAWFTGFLAGGKPYTLDIDRDTPASPYMLFINVRAQTPAGKLAVAGVGLDIDSMAKAIGNVKLAETGHARRSPPATPT
jgi:methyl-accepting chemotaxis protein